MSDEISSIARSKMEKAVEAFRQQLASLRTGKASIALLDRIRVDYYGSSLPLNQVASVGTPETRLITIQPWDQSLIPKIEKAILASDLGLTPSNDGSIIRLQIPPLTEERRRELVRVVKRMAEDGRVAVRNVRREVNEIIKEREKEGECSEDESHRLMKQIQHLTDEYIGRIDTLLEAKKEEILKV
ncbi:MAG TPA: ribosome recycling factor [Candidatus Latescibacteria bacterium]|nr:ribosome recycling factor [Candidatus Latescibacterota bacterium]